MPNSGQNAPGNSQYIVAAPDPGLVNGQVLTPGAGISITYDSNAVTVSNTATVIQDPSIQSAQGINEFTPVIAFDNLAVSGVFVLAGSIDQEVILASPFDNQNKVFTVVNGALAPRVCKLTGNIWGVSGSISLSPGSSATVRAVGGSWYVLN